MDGTTGQTDWELLEDYEWEPCESRYHHYSPDHDGDAAYLIRFHECLEPQEDSFRCRMWVEKQLAVPYGTCRICQQEFASGEFVWIIAEV